MDPIAFRVKYSIPTQVAVFGPCIGALDNNGESVELYKPDPPQTLPPEIGFVPYILVDKVRYNNRLPWPTLADGQGPSLQRRVPANYGDDPANWFTDLDADGIADDWEVTYQLSPFYAGDADLDLDGDGLTSLEEYLLGTDPRDVGDPLRITAVRREGDLFVFDFFALANRSYSVLYSNLVAGGAWNKLRDIGLDPTDRTIEIADIIPAADVARFYRVVTPQQP